MSAWASRNVARAPVVIAALGIMIASCAVIDSVLDSRVSDINRSAEIARNQAILLNIARASLHQPLNFVAISRIGGATASQVGVALPQFVVGPDRLPNQRQVTVGSSTLNTSMSANSTFDVGVLESRDFYTGLLTPVDLVTLHHFERQGYPRELLFYLFTDSVRITRGREISEYQNDPLIDRSCDTLGDDPQTRRCFADYVRFSVLSGLRSEIIVRRAANSKGSAKGGEQIVGRLCFDPVIARRAQQEARQRGEDLMGLQAADFQPVCGTSPDLAVVRPERVSASRTGHQQLSYRTRAIGQDGGSQLAVRSFEAAVGIEISTRSTYGIYQYLGRILATNSMTSIRLHDPDTDDSQILTVIAEPGHSCFVEVHYSMQYFCVPSQGAENTKRIFSLLAQLLALKIGPGDLPVIPAVRLEF